MDEKENKEFTIRDRRSSAQENAAEPVEKASKDGTDADRPSGIKGDTQKETAPLPELDFASFILSLATTVQMSLGAIPNPQTNIQAQNLPAAKQLIDIINMLKEKTKGNLSNEEQALIDSILYNLRMHYIRTLEGNK